MRKIISIIFFTFIVISGFNCKSKELPAVKMGPEINPNTVIRKIEIDQIKVGDKMIKANALIGKATEVSHKAYGSEHTWWLIPTSYSDTEYDTLKAKPSEVTNVKFIKLLTDSKGIIIDKIMDL